MNTNARKIINPLLIHNL
jgi:hypothetical protein